jgi:hypothetical protein
VVRTISDAVIAVFIVLVVLTGIASFLFKRARELIYDRMLGRLWQRITRQERDEEQQRKIQVITQEALAKQVTFQQEQELREAGARRDRIRAAHDLLTKSFTTIAVLASMHATVDVEDVASARQAAAQLRVEIPELSAPLTEISRYLQSPQNVSPARAHDLLGQVTAGVEVALRR